MELNAFAYITQKAANSWLAMRLDVLGLFVLCLAGVLCIQGSISPAMAGLCLLYALDTTRYLKFGTQMASQTESYFNSVERIVQVGARLAGQASTTLLPSCAHCLAAPGSCAMQPVLEPACMQPVLGPACMQPALEPACMHSGMQHPALY
jgi:hypothetical protein